MERVDQLKQFLEKEPNDSFLMHALAMEYKKQNKLEEALKLLETVIALDPDYIGSYYQLAKLYELTDQMDAAQTCYKKGISKASELNDDHACNELKSALEEISE